MSSVSRFDEELNSENDSSVENKEPFFVIAKKKNAEETLKWLKQEAQYLLKANSPRFETIRRDLQLYSGIQYLSQEVRTPRKDEPVSKDDVTKVVANHLFDLTEDLVSAAVKYRTDVAIAPQDQNDQQEAVYAKQVRGWLDHIQSTQAYHDQIKPMLVRAAKIAGEAYLIVDWDKNAGPLHPDSKRLREQGKAQEIEATGEDGKPKLDENGRAIKIKRDQRIGEVSYELEFPTNILLQRRRGRTEFSDVDFYIRMKLFHLEELKVDHPELADKLKPTESDTLSHYYDAESHQMMKLRDEVVRFEFVHRRTKYLPEGARIFFTLDTILEEKEFPFKTGPFESKLNALRLTDIDPPMQLHGKSFYSNLRGLAGVYNNVTNMVNRNLAMVAHPKWMFPKGSVNKEKLGNAITLVEFKGPTPPQLVQMNTTGNEVFNWRKEVREEMRILSRMGAVSKGEPPSGVDAFVSLQFLAEQESDRLNTQTVKMNGFECELAELSVAIAAERYDDSDGRQVELSGPNGAALSAAVTPKVLSRGYSFKISNASALPKSRYGRTQAVFSLREKFPNLFSERQGLQMLDLAADERFVDSATAAVTTAQLENEQLLAGEEVPDPQAYEDLIEKWRVRAQLPQMWMFQRKLSPDRRQAILDNLSAIEMLMLEKAAKNPLFAQKVAALELFPLVFVPGEDEAAAAAGDAAIDEAGAEAGAEELQAPLPEEEPALPADASQVEPALEVSPSAPPPPEIPQ